MNSKRKLTTWSKVLLEKLTIAQLVQVPAFYKNQAHHCSLSQTEMNPVNIFTSHVFKILLHLDLPNGLFNSGFLIKILYASPFYPMHNRCSFTGFVKMIRTAVAHDTPFGTVFNILILLQNQHSFANYYKYISHNRFLHSRKALLQYKPFRNSVVHSGICLYS
jgi:hypothetical protein